MIADLAEVEDCRRVVRETVDRFGGIDVLVNNAASTARGYLEDAPVELWDAIMHVNLRAPFLLLQEAVEVDEGARRRVDRQHRIGQRLHR